MGGSCRRRAVSGGASDEPRAAVTAPTNATDGSRARGDGARRTRATRATTDHRAASSHEPREPDAPGNRPADHGRGHAPARAGYHGARSDPAAVGRAPADIVTVGAPFGCRAAPVEDLDGEFPQVAPLANRALRPRHRRAPDPRRGRRAADRRRQRRPVGEPIVPSLYPPIAVTEQGAHDPRPVHDRLPHRGRDLLRRRRPDHLDGHPLPAQAGRRQPAGPDPRQRVAEFVWTVVPTLIVAFLFVISWQTLNVVDTARRRPTSRSAPSPASSSGSSTTSTTRTAGPSSTRQPPADRRPAPAAAWTSRPAGPSSCTLASHDVIHAFYVPQFLFKRDVVPGRTNKLRVQGQRQRRRPDVPRPVRRAVRHRPRDHALRRPSP